MDDETRLFVRQNSDRLQGKVLEIGSYNVNGGIKDIIPVTVGTDLRKGPGVDLVCPVELLREHFAANHFDACVSLGTLEHVENWKSFFTVTWDLVRDGGWLVMTMAARHKGRHNYPSDYWRFDAEQLRSLYPAAEWIGDVGKVSIGWVVQKMGDMGSMDFTPGRVK